MKYSIENIDEKDIDRIYEIESKTFTSNWKKESFVNQLKRESSLLRVIKNENNEENSNNGVPYRSGNGRNTNCHIL